MHNNVMKLVIKVFTTSSVPEFNEDFNQYLRNLRIAENEHFSGTTSTKVGPTRPDNVNGSKEKLGVPIYLPSDQ